MIVRGLTTNGWTVRGGQRYRLMTLHYVLLPPIGMAGRRGQPITPVLYTAAITCVPDVTAPWADSDGRHRQHSVGSGHIAGSRGPWPVADNVRAIDFLFNRQHPVGAAPAAHPAGVLRVDIAQSTATWRPVGPTGRGNGERIAAVRSPQSKGRHGAASWTPQGPTGSCRRSDAGSSSSSTRCSSACARGLVSAGGDRRRGSWPVTRVGARERARLDHDADRMPPLVDRWQQGNPPRRLGDAVVALAQVRRVRGHRHRAGDQRGDHPAVRIHHRQIERVHPAGERARTAQQVVIDLAQGGLAADRPDCCHPVGDRQVTGGECGDLAIGQARPSGTAPAVRGPGGRSSRPPSRVTGGCAATLSTCSTEWVCWGSTPRKRSTFRCPCRSRDAAGQETEAVSIIVTGGSNGDGSRDASQRCEDRSRRTR